jgi:hypothetical protein
MSVGTFLSPCGSLEEAAMKARTIALLVLAFAVAVVPHAIFATLWFGGGGLQAPAMPQFAGGGFAQDRAIQPVQPEPFFGGPVLALPQDRARTNEELKGLRGPVVQAREVRISGPHTQGNLTVFLIHGPDTMQDQKIIPLQGALEQHLAVVHEGAVRIDNRAGVPVFVQAGDIIKGGNQDRVLPYDYLITSGRQNLPVNALCVEAGRSRPRGNEISHSFQTSTEQLPGKKLHLAARGHSQAAVWDGIRQTQHALSRNVGGSVQAPQSQTSLQLTLEHQRVRQAVQTYFDKLAALPVAEKDVIGMAVAINGEIQGVDLYASSSLFREMWPKLLRSSAVAALAEQRAGASATPPTVEAIERFLGSAEQAAGGRQTHADGTLVLCQEAAGSILFDTCDPARQNLVLHRSILAK